VKRSGYVRENLHAADVANGLVDVDNGGPLSSEVPGYVPEVPSAETPRVS
jgi:hypothetical protein